MGPRLFSRGNSRRGGKVTISPFPLQWGRGFSAAETSAVET